MRRRGSKAKKDISFLHFLPFINIYIIYYSRDRCFDVSFLNGWSYHTITLDGNINIDEWQQYECQDYGC